jgi:hypothetical protein
VKRVVVQRFLFDFAGESRVEQREKELGGGEIVCLSYLS